MGIVTASEMMGIPVTPDYASRYRDLIDFLERLEAETKDRQTADKIRKYLEKEGIWPLKP